MPARGTIDEPPACYTIEHERCHCHRLLLVGALTVEIVRVSRPRLDRHLPDGGALAVWVIAATTSYHSDCRQPFQAHVFAKDLATVGGLLLLAALGAIRISLDTLHSP